MRVRSPFLWGWNETVASQVTVPMLIIAGEFDRGDGGIQALAELYQTVQSPSKLRFKVQCAGQPGSIAASSSSTPTEIFRLSSRPADLGSWGAATDDELAVASAGHDDASGLAVRSAEARHAR